MFPAGNLKPGQEVRFALVPAPSDTEEMEPVRVSIYGPGDTISAPSPATNRGDFVVTDPKGAVTAEGQQASSSAPRSITSFYHAALSQHIPPDTILKLLRVHSYDVDFKQKVKPGDTFDVFFDVSGRRATIAKARSAKLLYTSMTVDGHTRSF